MAPARILPFILVVAMGAESACGTDERGALDQPSGGGAIQLTPCESFVYRACGSVSPPYPCDNTASCQAAILAKDKDPDSCAARNQDEDTYTTCPSLGAGAPRSTAPACEDLVTKVCGTTCTTSDACVEAKAMRDASGPGDGGVTDGVCRQALGDETSFPRCSG